MNAVEPLTTTATPLPPAEVIKVPRHVAIIMDGNGRWAKSHGLPRTEGHRRGTENLRRILREARTMGIQALTIYAFSTENWSRPPGEVMTLMRLIEIFVDREVEELDRSGVQIRHVGSDEGVPPAVLKKIHYAIERTAHNTDLMLNVAFNYGGRDEIVHAVRQIVADGIPAEQVNEALINRYLYTHGVPDPDLIIRTSGELRISNFLIWQGAYAEYYATDVFWPDFDESELHKAIDEYSRRKRRYGMTDEQLDANG